MTSMAMSIIKDVAKYNRETGNLDLIITTGEAIRKMFIDDDNLEDKSLYLLNTHPDGSVRSYYKLKFESNERA